MKFYAGRCPVCRCTRIHRDEGWAEVSILGWTLGAAQDAQRPNRWVPLLPAFRFRRSHSRWQAGRSDKPAQILLAEFAALADDLQKPDPWMSGDDYAEGYVDAKNAAARRIRAVLAGEGPK